MKYRTKYVNGWRSTEHDTLDAALDAVREAMGWTSVVYSEAFAVGARAGTRGSMYAIECFATAADYEFATDGDPHAPRVLIIEGDEAWAMGQDSPP